MKEIQDDGLGREPLFLRPYSIRKTYDVTADKHKLIPHLHTMKLFTRERPVILYSMAYVELLSHWAGRLSLAVNPDVAAYFATTEDADWAIKYSEARFDDELESALGPIADDSSERHLTTVQAARILEVTRVATWKWTQNGALPYTVSSSGNYDLSEKGFRDFCQWQYPANYNPDATVRML